MDNQPAQAQQAPDTSRNPKAAKLEAVMRILMECAANPGATDADLERARDMAKRAMGLSDEEIMALAQEPEAQPEPAQQGTFMQNMRDTSSVSIYQRLADDAARRGDHASAAIFRSQV